MNFGCVGGVSHACCLHLPSCSSLQDFRLTIFCLPISVAICDDRQRCQISKRKISACVADTASLFGSETTLRRRWMRRASVSQSQICQATLSGRCLDRVRASHACCFLLAGSPILSFARVPVLVCYLLFKTFVVLLTRVVRQSVHGAALEVFRIRD